MINRIDIGAIPLSEGYFLARPDWAQPAGQKSFACISHKTDAEFLHVHPELSTSDLKSALLELIKKARRKVFVVSFILTDKDIVQALREKADQLNGCVYVVTCLDEQRLREGLDDDDNDPESSASRQMDCRKSLTEGGVWLRGCGECHAKYALADDEVAVVSTSNFEERPLTQGGETGIRLSNREEVLRIGRHFTRLWHECCQWEMPPGQNHTVAQRQPEQSPCRVLQPVDGQFPGAIWTDGDEHHVLHHLRRVIESAQKELLLATWDAVEVDRDLDLLVRPLQRAIERGVRIRMLARRRNPSPKSRYNMRLFANLGIDVFGDKTNHAKGAIADGQAGLMFSANFDLSRGLTSGIEMGVVLDQSKALADFQQYLNFAMHRATDVFVRAPSHAEMNERLFSHVKLKWPWGPSLLVHAESACWKVFSEACAEGPVLFHTTDEQSSLSLRAASHKFNLTRSRTGKFSLVPAGAVTSPPGRIPSGFKHTDPFGYCAAVFVCQSQPATKRTRPHARKST